MMRCTECGASGLERVSEPFEVRVGRRVFVGDVGALRCVKCGETFTEGADALALELGAATWFAEHGFATGEEIRFMRKAAGLRAADLAELLGVSAESVSHWETGKHQADRGTLATLAALVLDVVSGSTGTRERLVSLRKPARLAKVRLSLARASNG